ncbi:MAG: hypothetical protein J2P57_04465 [Acidimicrobiaceae bacterium]|nr:hypothetical protein [Acidimicrobiaceae bacterium]
MPAVVVEATGYLDAVGQLAGANRAVIEAVNTLTDTLYGTGAMAGSDTGGSQWAASYDPAAAKLVQAGSAMGEALANMANLLNGSLANHAGADHAAMIYPGEPYAASGDTNAAHGTETLCAPAPPSAAGGTGDQPGWWHWIAGHVGGLVWPDADTGRLRAAGSAWSTAGAAISSQQYALYAADSALDAITSPEMDDVHGACQEIATHLTGLGRMYTAIGEACNAYARHVDDKHREVEDELKSFVEWTIGIEAASGVLAFFTAGISEAAGQIAEGAEVANAAAKVIGILNELIELARTVKTAIETAIEALGRLTLDLAKFVNAKLVKALEPAGETILKNAPKGFLPDGSIDASAFTTEKDTAFFWSGRTDGVGGEKVAGEYASHGGGTTLEQLMEKRGIKLPEWDPDNPDVIHAWTEASKAYADGVSGEVRAVIGDNLRPGAVWNEELKALESNPNVTRIIRIDPKTAVQTVIWPK